MPPIRVTAILRDTLDAKPLEMRKAITACLVKLQHDPRHPGLHTKKMQGVPGVFESRASRGNRVTWEWDDDVVVIRNHCNHDILRRP